jgi:hypothetical protein
MGASDNLAQMQTTVASGQLSVSVPVLSRESFATLVGLTPATVYSMCDRGYLPTIHFGRRVFVNVEALRSICAAKALT